ncbi:MAG: hypothetical protein KJ970_16450 [Candidatus Eisenbacteria bacterium]|uniref:Uncharacterized protein n=1 Tax=Eiseniibacteriota bacterium TaxID=2212470 RepID=A0A948W4R6_UNCEI|nr:hypothetical protein [Candidatus Eisenbacteria bacterium]
MRKGVVCLPQMALDLGIQLFGNRRVDLLTFRSLSPRLRDRILMEAEIQW